WGLKDALKQPGNDAYVAKKLADHYGIKHDYLLTDLSDEPLEKIFNRFFVCGEGRIDNIGGYLDGFKIWKKLFESQIRGIVRGDEGLGREAVSDLADVRWLNGVTLCSDYSNLKNIEELGVPENQLPIVLQKKENETLEVWRDRIYHAYRMPYGLSAFNELKVSYVEVINPLLSRKITHQARALPDHLRTNKSLFKKIVNAINPHIEYATSSATADTKFLLQSQLAVDLFKEELTSANCKEILPGKLIDYILQNLKIKDGNVNTRSGVKAFLKRYLPTWLRKKLVRQMNVGKQANVNALAFRCYTISKMNQLFYQDIKALKDSQFSPIASESGS
ncbi:MAG: hypothetical protein JWQ25_2500, partial [Daejeonella sp.]|nr:hypothetical protein [Daejeonella sp.]